MCIRDSSNHLYATAAAGALLGMRTIGIVRGEEYTNKSTETLDFCRAQGMQLHAVSREQYRHRDDQRYLEKLKGTFHNPVSYTHLDVYKRQPMWFGSGMVSR